MSTKNLVAAGASRLAKAADSGVDPAVPTEHQPPAEARQLVPSGFDASTLVGKTASEQFQALDAAYANAEGAEFASIAAAKMVGTIQRGTVLKALIEDDRFKAGGYTSIGEYAKKVGINRQYVYDLITDAENLLAIRPLIEAAGHPLVASHAAILRPVYDAKGPAEAQALLELAKESGKLTAASLTDAARELGFLPAIPGQSKPSASSALPVTNTLAYVGAVYKAVAPANVRALVERDPAQALQLMDEAAAEIRKIERRIHEGRKLAQQALPNPGEAPVDGLINDGP
ncbi:hypothetical protein [Streptomyces sp. H27-S2]|uniref:hypothetical protein n=1 Tax=Streptomyces antarcticus TaxID=2996458 RepID=UPI00226D592D|nr:hypothetical protein [Streptomyces sp. H27-S2]MCY0954126.1 hypothetical protein [Streptomyces sp. H27-S2]